jgi:dolichol kinase
MLSFGLSVATRHILPMDASLASAAGLMLPYLGIITVGIGDAMAAIIGSKFGHFRWMKYSMENKRTVEGTLGGLVSMYLFSGLKRPVSDIFPG